MIPTLMLLMFFPVLQRSMPRCSPAVLYRDCWLSHLPGVLVDLPLSRSRGAELLNHYHAQSAGHCTRTCCRLPNDTCNVAVFSSVPARGASNCLHLHCPSQQSCIMRRTLDFTLFNVTRGEDADSLVFGGRPDKAGGPGPRLPTGMPHSVDKPRSYHRYVVPPSPQSTLSTSNSALLTLTVRTPLPSPAKPAAVTGSVDIGRGASTSPGRPADGLDPEVGPTREDSAHLKSTATTYSLGEASSSGGATGRNQTTMASWHVDLKVLLVPLLMLSVMVAASVCAVVWGVTRCKKKQGSYKPHQLHAAGKYKHTDRYFK
ncbi:MANSC domain-containing protein 4-like [Leucoraja erinacea]|uniref:MANSC domain-containing protein 4-like n=1 Tax=Leucoraja erinaceus TaxID=7782 RepID=UPI002457DED2|nr:MANSC domain-containing protein 4-like [Leucoraja erinacea]